MKHLLGIASVVCCIVLSTFDTFLDDPINNVAYWGVVISIVYMVVSTRSSSDSA